MAKIDEIGPEIYRISVFNPQVNLQFNHFLVKDDESLLFHAGYRAFFDELHQAVSKILNPAQLRWVSFSHFESDECGALNQWLNAAPQALPACNLLGAVLSVNDFAIRPPRILDAEEKFSTGARQFRFCSTAHVPHGWDAGVLFEETTRTLFCSDLLLQAGDVQALTTADIVEPARGALMGFAGTPFAYSVPYTNQTSAVLERLAALQPTVLATMHGSSFAGDGAAALRAYESVLRETMT